MQIPANAKKLAVDPLDRRARKLELPDVGVGNWTQVLSWGSKVLLSTEPFLQPPVLNEDTVIQSFGHADKQNKAVVPGRIACFSGLL